MNANSQTVLVTASKLSGYSSPGLFVAICCAACNAACSEPYVLTSSLFIFGEIESNPFDTSNHSECCVSKKFSPSVRETLLLLIVKSTL